MALPEQTSPNQSVLTVVATDADSGQNAEIVYSMGSSQIDSFTINPVTGEYLPPNRFNLAYPKDS